MVSPPRERLHRLTLEHQLPWFRGPQLAPRCRRSTDAAGTPLIGL